MWFAPSWKLLKDAWPAFVLMALVVLIFLAATMFAFSRCSPEPPDHMEEQRDMVLEQLKIDREKNDKRLLELEGEMNSLKFQVEILDEEIAESAQEREEIQDAISNAGSIDAIDRILKSGIPGATGGRRRK